MGKKNIRSSKGKTTTLTVQVHDPSKDPLGHIRVTLKDGLDDAARGATDEDGEVSFRGLERGLNFTIWVNDENTGLEFEAEKAHETITVEYEGDYEPTDEEPEEGDEDEEDLDSTDEEPEELEL